MRRILLWGFVAVGFTAAVVLVGCGSSSNSNITPASSTTTVTFSDPTTCSSGNGGTFQSIFVTVTDVQIHASATAGDNDPNWIDLTPDLKNSPKTIDLMSTASSQCFLATLGATTNLPPGTYQQVRVFLASSGNNSSCGSAGPNCVVLTASPNNPQPLLLSSQAQTGLKIPSGQIAGGQFTVAAGQNKTLNIDLDGCASIVVLGNGQYRLKPVLHAGEVNTVSNAIDGTLLDKTTGKAIIGAKAIVVLEVKDSAGIDRKFMQTSVDSSGHFSFCPVPALATGATYDLVAVVVSGTGVSYPAAIITGVTPGSSLGNILIAAVSGTNTTQGSISGSVSTATSAPAAIAQDVTLSVLAQANSSTFTIPLPLAQPSSTTANVNTQAGGTCAANTACNTYTLSVPGATPTVVAFTNGTPINFTTGGSVPASYMVEAAANCSATATTTAVSVSPGAASLPNPAPPLALTSCQ